MLMEPLSLPLTRRRAAVSSAPLRSTEGRIERIRPAGQRTNGEQLCRGFCSGCRFLRGSPWILSNLRSYSGCTGINSHESSTGENDCRNRYWQRWV